MFKTPEDFQRYLLALASEMKVAEYIEQSKILEFRARMPCTTGWEWLGEILEGVTQIRSLDELPKEIEDKLIIVMKTTQSETPYS